MGALLDLTTPHSQTQLQAEFLQDVVTGLTAVQKTLPCKYFYDAAGSQLFEQICELEEYYVTRTELNLLDSIMSDIAAYIGPDAAIIEPGSGAGKKIRLLLDSLQTPASYTPVEISKTALMDSAQRLSRLFPDIAMRPIAGDFDQVFSKPELFEHSQARKKVVFFPGSTIGNFDHHSAQGFLQKLAATVGSGGGLLIGIDLIKDRDVLLNAYNDPQGITEAFNKNLLTRINNELHGDFDLQAFSHRSIFNEEKNRIEMHLVSQHNQVCKINEHRICFKSGETIHTENSHKYSIDSFSALAQSAGFQLVDYWRDRRGWFSVLYFEV